MSDYKFFPAPQSDRFLTANPFGRFEYITIDVADPNVDVAVVHALKPEDPLDVMYEVVQQEQAGSVYHSPESVPWTRTTIYLRVSVAGVYKLRLSLEA